MFYFNFYADFVICAAANDGDDDLTTINDKINQVLR